MKLGYYLHISRQEQTIKTTLNWIVVVVVNLKCTLNSKLENTKNRWSDNDQNFTVNDRQIDSILAFVLKTQNLALCRIA